MSEELVLLILGFGVVSRPFPPGCRCRSGNRLAENCMRKRNAESDRIRWVGREFKKERKKEGRKEGKKSKETPAEQERE